MQCYLRDEFPAVSLPRLCLAGWSRFEAAPGETVIDRITIAARAFVYHDASGSERADPGAFILFTCPHSGDLTATGLRIYAGNP